jgi:hypothetical protein
MWFFILPAFSLSIPSYHSGNAASISTCCLIALKQGFDLYYFSGKKQGELDFLVEHQGSVLPIEIKSGNNS